MHFSRHAIYILPTRKAIPSSKVLVFTSCCFPKPAVHTAGPGEGLLFGELLLSAILAAHRVVFSGCLAGGGLREECDAPGQDWFAQVASQPGPWAESLPRKCDCSWFFVSQQQLSADTSLLMLKNKQGDAPRPEELSLSIKKRRKKT